jgi:hypothetical protein
MSSLGPDGDLLEREDVASEIPITRASTPLAPTNIAAAPLWMAFRDYYTRAKSRTRLNVKGEFDCDEFSQD